MASKYSTHRTTLPDLQQLVTHTPESNLWGYMTQRHVEQLLDQDSFSGFVDGQLIACGGIVDIWPGLAEAWIAVTPLAQSHPCFVYRTVRLYLADRIVSHRIRRLEAHVREDFHQARHFASKLDFLVDAPLKQYGPGGETFLLMSRVI